MFRTGVQNSGLGKLGLDFTGLTALRLDGGRLEVKMDKLRGLGVVEVLSLWS